MPQNNSPLTDKDIELMLVTARDLRYERDHAYITEQLSLLRKGQTRKTVCTGIFIIGCGIGAITTLIAFALTS